MLMVAVQERACSREAWVSWHAVMSDTRGNGFSQFLISRGKANIQDYAHFPLPVNVCLLAILDVVLAR